MATQGDLLEAINALSPRGFENLVFDLVVAMGMRNAVWRTPGADGGRDVEGDIHTLDFSGQRVIQRWYVECKRYATAVDWPTVWNKLAFADNHRAHSLLIATTSHLSPACKTEVAKWNASARTPILRYWDASTIKDRLFAYPVLLVKYGFLLEPPTVAASFVGVADALLRTVQAAYGHAEFAGNAPPSLEAAGAISELLAVRLKAPAFLVSNRAVPFLASEDTYPWLTVPDLSAYSFDRFGLRAILALLRHVTRATGISAQMLEPAVLQVTWHPFQPLPDSAGNMLQQVALWADLELRFEDTSLSIASRSPNAAG